MTTILTDYLLQENTNYSKSAAECLLVLLGALSVSGDQYSGIRMIL